jgi:hypothetical protein
MRLIDRIIPCDGRADEIEIYPLGDTHLGARNFAETPFRNLIRKIIENPKAYAIGGGDLLECINPKDAKRFDFDILPDWLVEGDAVTTREMLNDIVNQQVNRMVSILQPLADTGRLIGLIEGNHEYQYRKQYNYNVQNALCKRLGVEDLTDESLIRLRFKRGRSSTSRTVIIYLRHGYGGGRTAGAEPNKLDKMIAEWECADILFTGHTHTFDELSPKPVLGIPREGKLPTELTCHYRYAANWGCWLYSHSAGKSTYVSRACYPARPMLTVKAVIKPFFQKTTNGNKYEYAKIEMRKITI